MLKKLNRGLALMLAVVMVLGTLPGIAVFAEEPASDGLTSDANPVVGADDPGRPQGAPSGRLPYRTPRTLTMNPARSPQ